MKLQCGVEDVSPVLHANRRRVPWAQVTTFIALALGLGLGSSALVRQGADELLQLVAVYSPALAAVLVRMLAKRERFSDAGLGVRRVPLWTWLAALALPVSWHLTGAAFDTAMGLCQLHPRAILAGLARWPLQLAGAALFLMGEELGWRSYLVVKLRPAGPAFAFLFTGLVWFAWHPGVWTGELTGLEGATFLARVVALSFVFGWLYEASGSVWPCLALHVLHNSASPRWFQGARTCLPGSELSSDLGGLMPLVITVAVLWRLGAFRSSVARPGGVGRR